MMLAKNLFNFLSFVYYCLFDNFYAFDEVSHFNNIGWRRITMGGNPNNTFIIRYRPMEGIIQISRDAAA